MVTVSYSNHISLEDNIAPEARPSMLITYFDLLANQNINKVTTLFYWLLNRHKATQHYSL